MAAATTTVNPAEDLAFSTVHKTFSALFPSEKFPQPALSSSPTPLPPNSTSAVSLGGGSGHGYQVHCLLPASNNSSSPPTSRVIISSGGGSGGGLSGSLLDDGGRTVRGGGGGGLQYYPAPGSAAVSFGGGGGCETYKGEGAAAIEGIVCGISLDDSGSDSAEPKTSIEAVVAECVNNQGELEVVGGGGGGGGASDCCDYSVGYGFSFAARISLLPIGGIEVEGGSRSLLSDAKRRGQYEHDTAGYALLNASLECEGGYQNWCCTCERAKKAMEERAARGGQGGGVNWLEHASCCGGGSKKGGRGGGGREGGGEGGGEGEYRKENHHHNHYEFVDTRVEEANVRGGRCDLYSSDEVCSVNHTIGLAMTNCDGEGSLGAAGSSSSSGPFPVVSEADGGDNTAPLLGSAAPEEETGGGRKSRDSVFSFVPVGVAMLAGLGLMAATFATYRRANAERSEMARGRAGRSNKGEGCEGNGAIGFNDSVDVSDGGSVEAQEDRGLLMHTFAESEGGSKATRMSYGAFR